MGHVVSRGHNTFRVQTLGHFIKGNAIRRPLKKKPDDRCGVLIDQQTVAVIRVLPVAIGGPSANKFPIPHGLILLCPDFLADVGSVCLVYHVFQRHD